MSPSRIVAFALILIGVLMLGGTMLSYTTREKVVDIGPVEVTKERTHNVPMLPIAGGIAVAVGLGLMFADRRRA
jgi:hypothetical protein